MAKQLVSNASKHHYHRQDTWTEIMVGYLDRALGSALQEGGGGEQERLIIVNFPADGASFDP